VANADYEGYLVSVEDVAGVNASARREVSTEVVNEATSVIEDPADALAFTKVENILRIEPNYKVTAFGSAATPGAPVAKGDELLSTVGAFLASGGAREAGGGKLFADQPSDGVDWVDPEVPPGGVPGDGEQPIVDAQTLKFPDADPADPIYRDENNYQWGLRAIGVRSAWKRGFRGGGINVAVLDSGVNAQHEDLNRNGILDGENFFSRSGSNSYADDNGHGTFVASIITAMTNNMPSGKGRGMAGIADEADVIVYKVLGKQGEGYVSDLIAAYTSLLSADVDIVNMSFGHPGYIAQEDEVIQQLIAKGVIVVAAVGNDGNASGSIKDQINYPANYDNVIGVASSRSDGNISRFSTKNRSVDVAAPGENMAGLSWSQNSIYKVGGDGTSFASPVVAAAAAIAKQIRPDLHADSFMDLLKATSKDAGTPGYDTSFGYGILNIDAIITKLAGPTPQSVDSDGKSVLVKFNAAGGKLDTKNKAVFSDSKYGKLPVPKRVGYKFLGWFTKKAGGNKITAASPVSVAKKHSLYAHWQKKGA
jgi:uncharacterized repeat protein (TIGR02543 family)